MKAARVAIYIVACEGTTRERGVAGPHYAEYHLLRNRRLRNAQNSADVKQDASGCAKQFNYPEQCREEPDALEAYPNIPKLCLPKPSSATEYSVGTNNASRNPQSTTNTLNEVLRRKM